MGLIRIATLILLFPEPLSSAGFSICCSKLYIILLNLLKKKLMDQQITLISKESENIQAPKKLT